MKTHLVPLLTAGLLLPSTEVNAVPRWYIVNDSVMGGLSTSQIYEKNNNLIFSGTVSLENNGGFASVRAIINSENEPSKQIALRVKGDGKTYQLRLRTNQYMDGPAYTVSFDTQEDQWQIFTFTPSDFTLTFRGRTLEQQPTINFQNISQLGFMIAKKQQGEFKLEINEIAFKG
jgi:monofunctional biosynthetic peptidoglycan transglycosylase